VFYEPLVHILYKISSSVKRKLIGVTAVAEMTADRWNRLLARNFVSGHPAVVICRRQPTLPSPSVQATAKSVVPISQKAPDRV
jgi:hypothetical protein